MKFYLNIYKSDLVDKEKLSYFSKLVENEDYYFYELDECYRILIDIDQLIRGNIVDDLYKNLENIGLDQNTIYTFQKLNLDNDESILRLIPKIALHNKIISDFCNKLLQYYRSVSNDKYFYVIEFNNETSTMHRFIFNNENYKIDSYETLDNEIDEIEIYNYDKKDSQKISVKNTNEITILDNKFLVKKTFFKEKKIERLLKILNLIEVGIYYRGINCNIDIDIAPY